MWLYWLPGSVLTISSPHTLQKYAFSYTAIQCGCTSHLVLHILIYSHTIFAEISNHSFCDFNSCNVVVDMKIRWKSLQISNDFFLNSLAMWPSHLCLFSFSYLIHVIIQILMILSNIKIHNLKSHLELRDVTPSTNDVTDFCQHNYISLYMDTNQIYKM